MAVIPKHANGKPDWMGYLRTTWPILVTIIGLAFWFGGRLETPAQKESRIRSIIAAEVPPREVLQRLDRLEKQMDENNRLILALITEVNP